MSNIVVTFTKEYLIEEESIKRQQELIKEMFPEKKVSRKEIAEKLARDMFDLELNNDFRNTITLDFEIQIEE